MLRPTILFVISWSALSISGDFLPVHTGTSWTYRTVQCWWSDGSATTSLEGMKTITVISVATSGDTSFYDVLVIERVADTLASEPSFTNGTKPGVINDSAKFAGAGLRYSEPETTVVSWQEFGTTVQMHSFPARIEDSYDNLNLGYHQFPSDTFFLHRDGPNTESDPRYLFTICDTASAIVIGGLVDVYRVRSLDITTCWEDRGKCYWFSPGIGLIGMRESTDWTDLGESYDEILVAYDTQTAVLPPRHAHRGVPSGARGGASELGRADLLGRRIGVAHAWRIFATKSDGLAAHCELLKHTGVESRAQRHRQ